MVRGDTTGMHLWFPSVFLIRRLLSGCRLASQGRRVIGVLTFNIDSLEVSHQLPSQDAMIATERGVVAAFGCQFVALESALHDRVIQFHGNIMQLTTLEDLSDPYPSRSIAQVRQSDKGLVLTLHM
jgi:hypothetical protein